MGHAHSVRENPGQIAGIAALAAAVGAITAMLFTPRTGEQMRGGIKRRTTTGKDAVMEKIHSKKDDASETIENVKEKAADIKSTAKTKTREIKDTAEDTRRNRS